MTLDRRVTSRYSLTDEEGRLWAPGKGDLVRLRTWDILDRFLPPTGRVLDIGGGPGTHSAHLAARGHDVTLIDPIDRHIALASARAADGPARFGVTRGVAEDLPAGDSTADAALVMGPLYHLVERADRLTALGEARRVLRPGGRILAEVICRHAWLLDATVKERLDSPGIWDDFRWNIAEGLSQDPAKPDDGSFWAYFHQPGELAEEVTSAGFEDVRLVAVEGFAWLLGDLPERMADPERLLQAVRLTESEPTMLGCSAHVIAVATRP